VNYKFNFSLGQCIPRRYLVEIEVEIKVFAIKEYKKIIFNGYAYTVQSVHHNLVLVFGGNVPIVFQKNVQAF